MGRAAGKRSGYVVLSVATRKEGDQFVSWCPELDIASCGDTEEEATTNLGDALELYLSTLEREEERAKLFAERGIQIHFFEEEPVLASKVHFSQLTLRVPALG